MKEQPIIFQPEIIKTILESRCTMTRRTRGLEEINENPDNWTFLHSEGEYFYFQSSGLFQMKVKCPYGQAGDRLWVRETWSQIKQHTSEEFLLSYKATSTLDNYELARHFSVKEYPQPHSRTLLRWQSPLFMPRWASRILLEITEVRAERLQEITQADAVAEGIKPPEHAFVMVGNDVDAAISPKEEFAELWDSLNAKRGYGWDFNPWVFPISFKKI